ncbi:MAG: hypothetical protein MHMPM18_003598 [Marteilia pararefringens]
MPAKSPLEDDPHARNPTDWKKGDILRHRLKHDCLLMFITIVDQKEKTQFFGLDKKGNGDYSRHLSDNFERISKTHFQASDSVFVEGDRVQLLCNVDDMSMGTEFIVDVVYRETDSVCALFPGKLYGCVEHRWFFIKVNRSQ